MLIRMRLSSLVLVYVEMCVYKILMCWCICFRFLVLVMSFCLFENVCALVHVPVRDCKLISKYMKIKMLFYVFLLYKCSVIVRVD